MHLLLLLAALHLTLATPCFQNPSIRTFSFGNTTGTILSDGPLTFTENIFKVPFSFVRRSFEENFRTPFPLTYNQNVVLLDTHFGRVMIDTGATNLLAIPTFREGGQLFDNLHAAGIRPESIDFVLLTHGHPDHVAGLLGKNGTAAFPNARVYVTRMDHEHWVSSVQNGVEEDEGALIYVQSVAPYVAENRLNLVDDDTEALPGVRFITTPGHSPGHAAIEVTSEGERFVVVGDTWGSQPDTLQNPEWGFVIDGDTVQASKSRLKLLDLVAKRRDLVAVYHELFPGLGFVKKVGASFDWVPAAEQHLGRGVRVVCGGDVEV